MKIWKLETFIEADDNFTKKDILDEIDQCVSKGDGIYVMVDGNAKLWMIKQVKEKE